MQIESHFAPDVASDISIAATRSALANTAREHSEEIVALTKALGAHP